MRTRGIAILALAALVALPAAAQQPAPPAKKAKKVWTNDDLEALRERVPISGGERAGDTAASAAVPAPDQPATAAPAAEGQETPEQRMQRRIAAVRSELAQVEQELRSIRTATTSGKTTGQSIDLAKVDAGLNTEARVAQLEQRRTALLQQIDALETEARRGGMAPGVIR